MVEARAVPSAVAAAGIPALPSQAYLPNRDSAEQDLEMQSLQVVRNRQKSQPVADLPAIPIDLESTSESEPTLTPMLTPTSTIESAETKVPQIKPSTSEKLGAALGEWIDDHFLPKLPTNSNPKRQQEYDRVKRKELKDTVNGIPRLTAFQNSGDNFFNFRRFGNAATRILYTKQIELYQLVTKLEERDLQDEADRKKWGYRLESIEHDENWDQVQWNLMQEIEKKLNIYYDFYLKFQKIRSFGIAEPSDHRKLHDWIIENDPIAEEEKEYLFDRGDFMSSKKQAARSNVPDSKIVNALNNYTKNHPHSFLRGFLRAHEEPENPQHPHNVVYTSDFRFMILSRLIIALLAIVVILLAILVIWLGSQLSRGAMGALIVLFGLIFAAAVLAVTTTELEIFMGIAGCFAVVASVLANRNQGNGTGPTAG